MKRPTTRLLAAAIFTALASQAQAEVVIDVIGDNEVSFEGLVQADGNWYDNDGRDLDLSGNEPSGSSSETGLRRAELVLKGKAPKYDWVVGYDAFANKWLDVNLKYKMGGTMFLQAGQFKQPNSLEELSSTKSNDFISKAMVTNTFALSRRLGAAFGDNRENWGYVVTAFSRELTEARAYGQGYGGRVYYAPIFDDSQVLHFGISAVDYDTPNDTQRWRTRPDADLANTRLVDTGNILNADRNTTLGLEGMWVAGPWKLTGEYMDTNTSRTSATSAPDFNTDSWYVSGLWNITGETWGYKAGLPTTPLPNDPAKGMWQAGIRYDSINLNDGPINGGEEDNITLGVNYYWRSNFKVMVNYVFVSSSKFSSSAGGNVDNDPSIFETRLQFYW